MPDSLRRSEPAGPRSPGPKEHATKHWFGKRQGVVSRKWLGTAGAGGRRASGGLCVEGPGVRARITSLPYRSFGKRQEVV